MSQRKGRPTKIQEGMDPKIFPTHVCKIISEISEYFVNFSEFLYLPNFSHSDNLLLNEISSTRNRKTFSVEIGGIQIYLCPSVRIGTKIANSDKSRVHLCPLKPLLLILAFRKELQITTCHRLKELEI